MDNKTPPSVDAEQAGKEAYPEKFEMCNGCQGMYGTSDVNYYYRQAYIKGWQQGKEATPGDEKRDGGLRSKADVFEQAIRDFGIEAAFEYFNVKESDKQFFRNELSKHAATPSTDSKVDENENHIAEYLEKYRYEKSMTSHRIAKRILEFLSNMKKAAASTDSKEAIEVLKECDEYLSEEKYEKGKPVHLNYIGAYSKLHQKIKAAIKLFSPNEANK